jgi:hypothetical protein
MFSREMNPGLGRAGRFIPKLEALEERCCPSTVSLNSQTHLLTLTGDASNNTIVVRDDGHGDIQVYGLAGATAAHPLKYAGVTAIEMDSKTGNDHVDYALTAALIKSEKLTLNLGKGADQVKLDFTKGVSAASLGISINGAGGGGQGVTALFGAITNTNLQLAAHLGDGWNHFTALLNGDLTGSAKADVNVVGGKGIDGISVEAKGGIAASARLSVEANGGAGDNTVHADYSGKLAGALAITEQGNTGWEWMQSTINLVSGSTGSVVDHLVGGTGRDMLILSVQTPNSHLKSLNATISHVSRSSSVSHTSNVKVVS